MCKQIYIISLQSFLLLPTACLKGQRSWCIIMLSVLYLLVSHLTFEFFPPVELVTAQGFPIRRVTLSCALVFNLTLV